MDIPSVSTSAARDPKVGAQDNLVSIRRDTEKRKQH